MPDCVYEYPNTNAKLPSHQHIGHIKTERMIFIFLALLFAVFLPIQVSAAAHQITQWADNRAGGVSITFDDGFRSQYTMAVPALNARGIKGSFFLITGIVDRSLNSSYYASWDEWRNVASQGHEIGSHTKTHPHLPQLSLSEMEEEIGESKAVIDSQVGTQQCLTFVYPFGDYDANAKAFAGDYYIAARGVWCGFNKTPYNFYAMRGCGDSYSLDEIKSYTDAAEEQGKWLITYYHNLDGTGYESWTIDTFIAYLDYLQTKNLWVGTFGSIVKYIKERESASLSLIASSEDQIVLNLTDTLDDAIFDEPLTIRSEVPSGWTEVRVQQGTGSITVIPAVEETQTVIYYNVIPDRGFITLQKLTTNQQPTVSVLSPSSATVGGASFTLTVHGNNFVNGATVRWNNSNRPTTFVSENQLMATISASDIANIGTASVAVRNPSGDISNGMNFEVRNAALTITIQKTGTGTGALTGNGISCGSDCTEIYSYGTSVVLTASPSTGSSFSGWTGCDTTSGNTCTVNMTANKSVSAAFTLNQHTLTLGKSGNGSGALTGNGISCGTDCTEICTYGTVVTFTATAATGSTFSGWTGCGSVSGNTCTVTMTANKTVTASFTLNQHTLNATRTGTGSGTVSAPGLSCTDNTCKGKYTYSETIHINAKASSDSILAGWSGCDSVTDDVCTLLIDRDRDVTAILHRVHTLVVSHEGTGDGRITSVPLGIDCEPACSDTFIVGTPVQLTALPYDGSVFAFWSGGCAGTAKTCDLQMTDDITVATHFVPYGTKEYKLKVKGVNKNQGDGMVISNDKNIDCGNTCSYRYYKDTIVTLSATPNQGSTFLGWKPETPTCKGTETCTVSIDKATTVQALFVGDYMLKVIAQSKKGGAGLVSSTPSGISCSTGSTAGCEAFYGYGQEVTLSASADTGSTFLGWAPAKLCPGTGVCIVPMDKKRTVKAVFSRQ